MPTITILDPRGVSSFRPHPLALRPTSLNGLRVGLLHNAKPGGDVLLEALADQLSGEFALRSVVRHRKALATMPAPFLQQMATECDVVIAALAD